MERTTKRSDKLIVGKQPRMSGGRRCLRFMIFRGSVVGKGQGSAIEGTGAGSRLRVMILQTVVPFGARIKSSRPGTDHSVRRHPLFGIGPNAAVRRRLARLEVPSHIP